MGASFHHTEAEETNALRNDCGGHRITFPFTSSMPKKRPKPAGVTPEIILDHMRGMEVRIRTEVKQEIGASEGRLCQEIGAMEVRLNNRIDRVYVNLTTQIDGIDHRLDDIEVFQLPKLKKAVGMRQ